MDEYNRIIRLTDKERQDINDMYKDLLDQLSTIKGKITMLENRLLIDDDMIVIGRVTIDTENTIEFIKNYTNPH